MPGRASRSAETDDSGALLRSPSNRPYHTATRNPSSYNPLHSFELATGDDKHYQQQYGDMYFLRLASLKPAVEAIAADAWDGFQIAGETVRRVDRVLDVRQGDLSWVAGTVYMDMPLKPNILDDISKDHWISAPPPREKMLSESGDQIMLEDESGRLRLSGTFIQNELLVTGCIIAVMGTENANGDFEVIDMKVPDLPRQPQRWEREGDDAAVSGRGGGKTSHKQSSGAGKVAIVSGLAISGDEADSLSLDLLMEWLLGEAASQNDQEEAARISRLIIAGNSLAEAAPIPSREELASRKASKKYGYDSAAFNPAPPAHLDALLATLLPSIPITLIPGASDPASVSLPQQPIHPAMFPQSRTYSASPGTNKPGWFDSVTNPWAGDVDGWRILATGGQPVDDIFKYVHGDDRLEMMEHMMRWRCCAPTAPDTLWCYPFQDKDQFVIEECPHVFIAGNQPKFGTGVVGGTLGQQVRLIAVPKFKETGQVVLLDLESLDVELIDVGVYDSGG